jgi:tRNA threonylcarbamoyladenosine biosynthesis protein TsaE
VELTYSIQDISDVAKQIIKQLNSKTLLFIGEMGSGKTTFIKALVKELGSSDSVSSPTFSIVNEYKTETDTIYHFDMYRIENIEELYNLGIEEYLTSNAWKMIEWPERIAEIELFDVNILTFYNTINDLRTLKLTLNTSINQKKPMIQQNFM